MTFIFTVHGSWGPWGSWGTCSRSCNGGQVRRYRGCDSPRPSSGGRACAGADMQIQRCGTGLCPGECLHSAADHTEQMWDGCVIRGMQNIPVVICNFIQLRNPLSFFLMTITYHDFLLHMLDFTKMS